MTAEPAVNLNDAYPCKDETELWRDEKAVQFQAGSKKCRSPWDVKECFKDWIKHEKVKLAELDYQRTRHIILTVDLKKYESPQAALEYFQKYRPLAGLIRNLKRGKKRKEGKAWVTEYEPLIITKWRAYLEWYRNGGFHIHCLIEVGERGAAGMIGATGVKLPASVLPVTAFAPDNEASFMPRAA